MADSTISVRASDDVKAKFQAICAEEPGIKSGDLLEKLISTYELSKQTAKSANKKRYEEYDQIINALQIKFRDVVIALDVSEQNAAQKIASALAEKQSLIDNLSQQISVAKDEVKKAKEESSKALKDRDIVLSEKTNLDSLISSLEADKTQLLERIKDLQEQNASMISKVNEFEKMKLDLLATKESLNSTLSELAVIQANLEISEKKVKEKEIALAEVKKESEKTIIEKTSDFSKRIADYDNQTKELKSEFKAQQEKMEARYETQITDFRKTIEDLRKSKEALNMRLEQALNAIEINPKV